MHIFPFQALYPDPQRFTQVPDLFDVTRERYNNFVQAGLFLRTDQPGFFLYRIQTKSRHYLGLLACTDIADYLCGDIKKHESTMPDEERKQMLLTIERNAAVKPVLLVYPDAPQIDTWIARYVAQHEHFLEVYFPGDEQRHQLWWIQEVGAIQQLQALFAQNVPHAYIADGHHRMAAFGLLAQTADEATRQQYQHVYCAFFPSVELDILEFNRVVEIPAGFDLQQLAPFFTIQPLAQAAKPTRLHEMTLCTPQGWYQLQWKAEVLQLYDNESVVLDTMLLNEKIIQPLLGIEDIRHDRRVEYIDAPKGLEIIEKKIKENHNKIGFCLYPVDFNDLMKIVEANQTLPPKSTWFEPRMKNGLLVKPY
ncbi:MAG: DUF1015 family protein [Saprospiraceae bacterium]